MCVCEHMYVCVRFVTEMEANNVEVLHTMCQFYHQGMATDYVTINDESSSD